MPDPIRVTIHASQFPQSVRRDLLESLRSGQVNHKFHYDSLRQTQKWLALHQAYSPSRTDKDCAATYDKSFVDVTRRISSPRVHLIGLGCGGGQKDTRVLAGFAGTGREIFYTPADVSVAMVLLARQTALAAVAEQNCFPLVCDLATADDLPLVLGQQAVPDAVRLVTFFGMIPNFEPQVILPRLAALLSDTDFLLFSANLAPGLDYAAGVKQVLPLYNNQLTREWLMLFLDDVGVDKGRGEVRFVIEEPAGAWGLRRIAAYFHFTQACQIRVDEERFDFRAGDSIRLFFSYRHTPELVRTLLQQYGLKVLEQWITASEEEGVFLVRRQ